MYNLCRYGFKIRVLKSFLIYNPCSYRFKILSYIQSLFVPGSPCTPENFVPGSPCTPENFVPGSPCTPENSRPVSYQVRLVLLNTLPFYIKYNPCRYLSLIINPLL